MTQVGFDFDEAERLRLLGMDTAEFHSGSMFERARGIALRIALARGEVTIDDVLQVCPSLSLGNASGNLFRGGQFVFTGRWRKSSRVTNHARANRVWELAK